MHIQVDVKVIAPELAEAINRLALALPSLSDRNNKEEYSSKEEINKCETEPKKDKSADSKNEEQKCQAVTKEPGITLENIRTKLAALSQEGKQAQVKALITGFQVKKLSDIPEEKYPELLKKASEL